jgi:two-component system, OmpR family, response regulator VicR
MKIIIIYDFENPEPIFHPFKEKTSIQTQSYYLKALLLKPRDFDGDFVIFYLKNINNHDQSVSLLKKVKFFSKSPVVLMIPKNENLMHQSFLAGADDVLFHHYSNEEILVRLLAIYRRYYEQTKEVPSIFEIGDMKINHQTYEIKRGNKVIPATKIEYEIIRLLASEPQRVFPKKELYERIWKDQYYDSGNVLNVHIRRLRKKIEDNPDEPRIILTKWGIGYSFNTLALTPK